ncbi:MAG TPA: glycosyltransferase, partial [Marinagarivorans sp.]
MKNTPIETAIITVTYNCEDFIEDFLDSVACELTPESSSHLFIVDNLSADDTVNSIKRIIDERALHERVTLLPKNSNLGFGAGCNAGVTAARDLNPKYYWFLNPDTQVFPDTRSKLVEFL